MPFTARGNHSVNIYSRFPKACKYYSFGTLSFNWVVPEDIEEDSVFRLKLTTETPSTTHLSGKLRLSHADGAAPAESTPIEAAPIETGPIQEAPVMDVKPVGVSCVNVAGILLAVVLSILLACLVALRLRRRSKQIVLG